MKAVRKLARPALFLLGASLLLSAGCGSAGDTAAEHTKALDAASIYGEALSVSPDWQRVAAVGGRELSINGETMAIRLTDERTGKVWTSSPDPTEIDRIGDENAAQTLRSQFELVYHDVSNNVDIFNSYHDSLAYDQVTLYPLENGVAVHYVLGDRRRGEEDVPQKITDGRFRKKVLAGLSDDESEEMQSFYRFYEDEGYWMLAPRGKNDIDRVLALFDKAGYTTADLIEDQTAFGESATATEKPLFEVVLEYRLDEDGLVVSVPMERLRFSDNYPIRQIRLLEGLLSAPSGSEGYLFVPDGSGALMRFDAEHTAAGEVSLPIYGTDPSVRSKRTNTKLEAVSLPVFGIKNGGSAMLAIVEENAAGTTVEAYRNAESSARSAVYAVFDICAVDYVYIAGSDTRSSVPVFDLTSLSGECRVRYCPLSADKASYTGMAERYRDYLTAHGGLPAQAAADTAPLLIETVGGVYGYKTFLGLSHTGLKAATTFEQSGEIVRQLKESGVDDLRLKISGWFNDGYAHDYAEKVSPSGELGGKKALRQLDALCRENGVPLYPDAELLIAYRTGNGFSLSADAARYLDVTEVQLTDLSPVDEKIPLTGRLRENGNWLVSPARYPALFSAFGKRFSALGIEGLSLRSAGGLLYADMREEARFARRDAEQALVGQIAALKDTVGSLLTDGGNAYILPYADAIDGAPVDYSYFTAEDEAVPFYQLVTHGRVAQTGMLMNTVDDVQQAVLRCIEYGVGLRYRVTWQPSSYLKNTENDSLYRSCFSDMKAEILTAYRQVDDALSGVGSAQMVGHERLAGGLYRTTYDNGTAILVNYTDAPQTAGGQTVAANGYAVLRADDSRKG